MKKIEINLYPHQDDSGKTITVILEKFLAPVFIALFILVIIHVIFFTLALFFSINYRHLSAKWEKALPQAQAIASLKSDTGLLKEKQKRYQEVANIKIGTSQLLASIFSSLPRNIWLDEINYNGGSVNFIGYAVEWKEKPMVSVDGFIKNLKKEKIFQVFKEINLKNSRKANLSGTEVIKFEVECKSIS